MPLLPVYHVTPGPSKLEKVVDPGSGPRGPGVIRFVPKIGCIAFLYLDPNPLITIKQTQFVT